MRKLWKGAFAAVLSLALIASAASARSDQDIDETFEKKSLVRVSTVSSDCIVKKGQSDEIRVELTASYRPADCFEPEIRQRESSLMISEDFDCSCKGNAVWTITVPEGTRIRFSSASGDFEMEGLKAKVAAETASGDITIRDADGNLDIESASGDAWISGCSGELSVSTASGDVILDNLSGEIDVNTASGDIEATGITGLISLDAASGDIEIENSRGEFNVGVASGDVDASGVILEEQSCFGTASGSVVVELGESATNDLEISSASGRAVLNYGGNPVKGSFEFIARVDRGRITSPLEFDDEETFYRHDKEYHRKSFTKGNDTPHIAISTSSGKATLKLK